MPRAKAAGSGPKRQHASSWKNTVGKTPKPKKTHGKKG